MERHSARTGCFGHTEFSTVTVMVGSGDGQCGWTTLLPTCCGCRIAWPPVKGTSGWSWVTPSGEVGTGTYCQGLRSSLPLVGPTEAGTHQSRPATQQTCTQGLTTSVLTAAMLVYALGAGITAAAGTRLALQLVLITVFGLHPSQVPLIDSTDGTVAVRCCLARMIVHWAICAPAAHLGSGRHVSGALSGIEP